MEKPCGRYRKGPIESIVSPPIAATRKTRKCRVPKEKPAATEEELEAHSAMLRDFEETQLCDYFDRQFPRGDCELHTYWDRYVRSDIPFNGVLEQHCYFCKDFIEEDMYCCGVKGCRKVYHKCCLPHKGTNPVCPCHTCPCGNEPIRTCVLCPASVCASCTDGNCFVNDFCPECSSACVEKDICHVFTFNT
jgi:hypothetical protein